MRYVIFSDLHGNSEALRKMLQEEPPLADTTYIFCGDIVGYYYDTPACVEILRALDQTDKLRAVCGNHDRMYADAYADMTLTEELVGRYGSAYLDKHKIVLDYLLTLPQERHFCVYGRTVCVQHGSPWDHLNGRIYPDTVIHEENGFELGYDVALFGHTHYQCIRNIGNTLFLNPGSIGQPRDGKGFSYAILDAEKCKAEFKTVECDCRKIVRQVNEREPYNNYLIQVLRRNGIRA